MSYEIGLSQRHVRKGGYVTITPAASGEDNDHNFSVTVSVSGAASGSTYLLKGGSWDYTANEVGSYAVDGAFTSQVDGATANSKTVYFECEDTSS